METNIKQTSGFRGKQDYRFFSRSQVRINLPIYLSNIGKSKVNLVFLLINHMYVSTMLYYDMFLLKDILLSSINKSEIKNIEAKAVQRDKQLQFTYLL